MARGRLPRTDFGTVLLHWLIVAFLVVAVATGLRIAADVPGYDWLTLFDSILPRENLWYWHLIGALGFTASVISYITYILAARLGQRTRLDRTRLATLFRPGPPRWAALSVLLVWMVFGAFAVEIVSGTMLYLGQAGWALLLHRNIVWICLAFPVLHIIVHYAYGGMSQLLRIFRPARLVVPPRRPDILALLAEYIQLVDDMRRGRASHRAPAATGDDAPPERNLHPLLLATCASIVVVAAGLSLERGSAVRLLVPSIAQLGQVEAPVLDGDISDAVWAGAPMVSVLSDEGANFGGTGQSRIDVKAVHDAEQIYF
ncbi:MAG TPA: cytochrome b/b6 domain-containing protein, partial [Arsenicitalea sp.]|nr:cytochrome b/b6 domain-containing protein [Arsenicitalea sp.]